MTSVLSKPQKALTSTIETGHVIIEECAESLETKAELPELGTDPASIKWKQVTLDSNKQTVTSQIAAMNAATAEVVTLTSCKFVLVAGEGSFPYLLCYGIPQVCVLLL